MSEKSAAFHRPQLDFNNFLDKWSEVRGLGTPLHDRYLRMCCVTSFWTFFAYLSPTDPGHFRVRTPHPLERGEYRGL